MHPSDATASPRCHPGPEPGKAGRERRLTGWTPDRVRGDSGGAETVPSLGTPPSLPPPSPTVMPGLVPGIHVGPQARLSPLTARCRKTWMPGTSPGMTAGGEECPPRPTSPPAPDSSRPCGRESRAGQPANRRRRSDSAALDTNSFRTALDGLPANIELKEGIGYMKVQHVSRRLRRFVRANEAVSALEYAILVGVITIAVGAALVAFSENITDAIAQIGGGLDSTVDTLSSGDDINPNPDSGSGG